MNITYKQLSESHLSEIQELDSRFKSPWSTSLYQERIELYPGLAHGAYREKELVGFILGKRISPSEVYISRVVVREDLEGKGIAKKLIKNFEKHAKSKRISSRTRSGNKRSIYLHKRSGYSKDPDYHYVYSDNETGIKFFKDL
jgi:ribosomal protein S18 acetylase RimI-like enzyme